MKPSLFRLRDLLWCAGLVAIYAVLFQVMVHTRMIEKVMASTFSWWELLLIVGFLVSRILTYLLVPSVVVALGVYGVARWGVRKLSGE